MNEHDHMCPALSQDSHHAEWCKCELISRVRSEEKGIFQGIWQANLRPLEVRNYQQGYQDAIDGKPPRR